MAHNYSLELWVEVSDYTKLQDLLQSFNWELGWTSKVKDTVCVICPIDRDKEEEEIYTEFDNVVELISRDKEKYGIVRYSLNYLSAAPLCGELKN